MKAVDKEKMDALASILVKGGASYRQGMSIRQIMDIMDADPDDYPMSTAWVRKYILSDDCAAHGIIRSSRQTRPYEFYFDPARAAHAEAKHEIMSSASVSEALAEQLIAMEERLSDLITSGNSSAGTNAKMPKHVYYAYKFFSAADEDAVLKLMDAPKPSELGVTEQQLNAVIGSILRQGKAKIGGKRKSD